MLFLLEKTMNQMKNMKKGEMKKYNFLIISVQLMVIMSILDFRLLIEAIVREGMYIDLWYPKGKINEELIYAADSRTPLTVKDVFSWCTADFNKKHPLPAVP